MLGSSVHLRPIHTHSHLPPSLPPLLSSLCPLISFPLDCISQSLTIFSFCPVSSLRKADMLSCQHYSPLSTTFIPIPTNHLIHHPVILSLTLYASFISSLNIFRYCLEKSCSISHLTQPVILYIHTLTPLHRRAHTHTHM